MTGVVAARLAQLGLELPVAPQPLADYVAAVRTGNLVFTAGQLPLVGGQLPATGVVGADVSPELAHELAGRAALNAIATLGGLGIDPDQVTAVVKVTGFVASSPRFTGQPAVVNGASKMLTAAFAESGRHARSAVGVASLPLGAPVEIEVIFEIAAG